MNCHYDASLGWLTVEHVRDCKAVDCKGCKPCPETHCAMLGRCAHHVDVSAGITTCPSCIGKVRRNLQAIEDRYAELPEEAEYAGVDSEAANLAGPAAAPEQIAARRRYDLTRGWCAYPRTIAEDDPHHAYGVLGRWDMALREDYNQPTDLLITISRAKDYLDGMLDHFAQDQPQAFEEFARDVARCLTHVEEVLRDSRRPETGVQCPTCRTTLDGAETRAPRLVKHYDQRDTTGATDRWICPEYPGHWWSEADYRLRVGADFLEHAEALTADDAAQRFGIKATVIRVWGSRELVRKRGKNAHGITLYDVGDIAARHAESA